MEIETRFTFSDDFVKLFRKENYESFVLCLMNRSKIVFKGTFSAVTEQSNGECDFVEDETGRKFDAKLPFLSKQIEMLTDGKRHKADLEKWLSELRDEAAEFDLLRVRDDPSYDIAKTKLYLIMKQQIEKERNDEDIVFFLPYPMTLRVRESVYLQFASDYFNYIYSRLASDIDLGERRIYAIYPSSERNCFVLRDISSSCNEYLSADDMQRYFTFEIVAVETNEC